MTIPAARETPRRPRRSASPSGQALVEFALVLPILAVLCASCFTGWSAIHDAIGTTGAARAGALAAAVDMERCISQSPPPVYCSGSAVSGKEKADALQAVQLEENDPSYILISTGQTCTTACVVVSQSFDNSITDPNTGGPMQVELVTVYKRAPTEIAVLPGVLVKGAAAASP